MSAKRFDLLGLLITIGSIGALGFAPQAHAATNLVLACPDVPACTSYTLQAGQNGVTVATVPDATSVVVTWKKWQEVAANEYVRVCPLEAPVGGTCPGTRATVTKASLIASAARMRSYTVEVGYTAKYIDDTPVTDLTGVRFENGISTDGPFTPLTTVPLTSGASPLTGIFQLPSQLQQCFRAIVVTSGHGESEPSSVVCAPPEPDAPLSKPAVPLIIKVEMQVTS